jgi:hypothetical protein
MPTTTVAPPTLDIYAPYGLDAQIYWTPAELSPIIGRSPRLIRESARNGHLRPSRTPGRTKPRHVYHRDEVVAWLESELEVTPEPAAPRAPARRPAKKVRRPRAKRPAGQAAPAGPPPPKDGVVRDGIRVRAGKRELF